MKLVAETKCTSCFPFCTNFFNLLPNTLSTAIAGNYSRTIQQNDKNKKQGNSVLREIPHSYRMYLN